MFNCKICGCHDDLSILLCRTCFEIYKSRVLLMVCDRYCTFPDSFQREEDRDVKCTNCEVAMMLDNLEDIK